MTRYERLSPQDASFLYMESPTTPMHVGALSIFEDTGLGIEDIYEHIDRRLNLVPHFRKKLTWIPYGQGRPVWVDDEHFDVRYHVRHTGLPRPAGERELLATIGRIQSIHLDRNRPLWEIWVVDLPGDRRALIQKTHHAMIDGVSGVDLATVMFDLSPDVLPLGMSHWEPEPEPTKAELLRSTMLERVSQPAEIARSVRAATRTPRRFVGNTIGTVRDIMEFGRAGIESAPPTSLNEKVGSHRRFEIVRSSLEAVKAIKTEHRCTVNDVVLAIAAGGLRRLLQSRGDDMTGLQLRVLVPVSVRRDSERMTFGNRVAGLFARLPVDEPDPLRRLLAVQDEMRQLKASHEPLGAEAIMRLADYAPPTLLSLAGRVMAHASGINLTVTNVPGPQFPLYFLGGRLLEIFPYVPLAEQTDVGIAALSYNGQLNYGLTGDWDTAADLAVLADGIEKSLEELA